MSEAAKEKVLKLLAALTPKELHDIAREAIEKAMRELAENEQLTKEE